MAAGAGLATASCIVRAPAPLGRSAQSRAGPLPIPAAPAASPQPPLSPLLREAFAALDKHGRRIVHRDRIGVVDFARPSSEPRFHLVNVESRQTVRSWLVAHGSGSDPAHTGMLQSFSNAFGSHATSRGAYLTANPYFGKYGRSQRLVGLDPENDLALDRAIVLHGAPYVDPALIAAQGRIGRSQGCFAVEPGEVGTVMGLLGEGRMIYAAKLV